MLPVTGIAGPGAISVAGRRDEYTAMAPSSEQHRRRHADAQLRQPVRIRVRLGRALQVHQHHDEQIQHDDAAGVDQDLDRGEELRAEQHVERRDEQEVERPGTARCARCPWW